MVGHHGTLFGGGFGELNMEVLLAKNPDLVLASSLNSPEQIQSLTDATATAAEIARIAAAVGRPDPGR